MTLQLNEPYTPRLWRGYAEGPGVALYPDLHRGLITAWPVGMQDSGGWVHDLSGRGPHLRLDGNVTWQTTAIGSAALIGNGVDDHLQAGSVLSDNADRFSEGITCYVRFYANALPAFTSLFDDTARSFSLFIDDSTSLFYGVGATAGGFSMTTPWSTGVWTSAAMTALGNGGSNVKIYRDAVLEASGLDSGTNWTGTTWRIGANPSGGGAQFDGYIAEAYIWARALEQHEIQLMDDNLFAPFIRQRHYPFIPEEAGGGAASILIPLLMMG